MSRLLVDFDSTLNNLDEHQVESVNAKFGTAYHISEIDSWDWWKHRTPKEHEEYVWCDTTFHSRDWTLNMKPQPNAVDSLRKIKAMGHEIYIVSDRKTHMREWLLAWLELNNILVNDVVVTDKVTYPKTQAAMDYGLEVVIEDAAHNINALAGLDSIARVFVMDKGWNRTVEIETNPKMKRIHDWYEVYEAFLWRSLYGTPV